MSALQFGSYLDVWKALVAHGEFRREPMIFFRSSDRSGHAVIRWAKTGSDGICVPPCVP